MADRISIDLRTASIRVGHVSARNLRGVQQGPVPVGTIRELSCADLDFEQEYGTPRGEADARTHNGYGKAEATGADLDQGVIAVICAVDPAQIALGVGPSRSGSIHHCKGGVVPLAVFAYQSLLAL